MHYTCIVQVHNMHVCLNMHANTLNMHVTCAVFRVGYLCLPMFTYVYFYLPLFAQVYLCISMTLVYRCLPLFTHFYPCLPLLIHTLFTLVYPCLSMFTYIYLCLPMFTYVTSVYPCITGMLVAQVCVSPGPMTSISYSNVLYTHILSDPAITQCLGFSSVNFENPILQSGYLFLNSWCTSFKSLRTSRF